MKDKYSMINAEIEAVIDHMTMIHLMGAVPKILITRGSISDSRFEFSWRDKKYKELYDSGRDLLNHILEIRKAEQLKDTRNEQPERKVEG